jgi:hypothetical protein
VPYAKAEDRLARQRVRRATSKGRTQLRAYRLTAKRKPAQDVRLLRQGVVALERAQAAHDRTRRSGDRSVTAKRDQSAYRRSTRARRVQGKRDYRARVRRERACLRLIIAAIKALEGSK